MRKVAIIDYGMGNIASVEKAINHLGYTPIITRVHEEISASDFIILPGVGAFSQGMKNLNEFGLIGILNEEVMLQKKPFFGICLGMQLITTKGFEPIETAGLGWIEGEVIRMIEPNKSIPHLGWNEIYAQNDSFIKNFDQNDFYFIHSFHTKVIYERDIAATVNYGHDYVAAIQRENIFATQFHPEKSQSFGLELIESFFEYYA